MSPTAPVIAPKLDLNVFATRKEMGAVAAKDIADRIRELLQTQASVRIIFAAAPSQADMLESLRAMDVPWERIEAFHMDEYLDLAPTAAQRFGLWLRRHLFDLVPVGKVHFLEPGADPEVTTREYAALVNTAPIDVVCCGIGSNGHLAFNDPPAVFDDPETVKVVELDAMCRQQQVDDKCFATIDAVPTHAVTVTIPALLAARSMFCCVPGAHKRNAVDAMIHGPITNMCPASILRTHADSRFYLDEEAAPAVR